MLMPVRCVSCGKPIGHLWEKYKKEVKKGRDPGKVLDKLGVERYCCRTVFLTNVDMIDHVSKFKR